MRVTVRETPYSPGMGDAMFAVAHPVRKSVRSRADADQHSRLGELLESAKRLTGADGAVVIRHNANGDVITLASTSPADTRLIQEALRQDASILDDAAAHWFPIGSIGGAGYAYPLEERARSRSWLFLRQRSPDVADREHMQQAAKDVATLLASHLELRSHARRLRRQERAAVAALQQTECGIVVLRSDRSVAFCNEAATELLNGNNGLQLRDGMLKPMAYHDAVRFHTAIDCVVSEAANDNPGRRSGVIMLIARPQQDRPLIVVVAPAGDGHAESGGAAAIVYLLSPDGDVIRGLEPICQLHGLSKSETRLVTLLVGGSSIAEASAAMRIKPDTARTYLKQIFAKTRTHRQVELVRLFQRYLRAVRGDFDYFAA
jgi:DNA-binding CsgD family transcriptional regulator/PAS domain-containing protein